LDIKLIDINDVTNISTLTGHTYPIIHLSIDCKGDYLLSASSNGAVYIWDLIATPPLLIKKFEGLIDKQATGWNASWNDSKGLLAFPGRNKSIVVMEKDSWQILYNIATLHVSISTTILFKGH